MKSTKYNLFSQNFLKPNIETIIKEFKNDKPFLFVLAENHRHRGAERKPQIFFDAFISSISLKQIQNLYVEGDNNLLKWYKNKGSQEQASHFYAHHLIKMADDKKMPVIMLEKKDLGDGIKRNEAMISTLYNTSKSGLVLVGSSHLEAIVTDKKLNSIYNIVPFNVSKLNDKNLQENLRSQEKEMDAYKQSKEAINSSLSSLKFVANRNKTLQYDLLKNNQYDKKDFPILSNRSFDDNIKSQIKKLN